MSKKKSFKSFGAIALLAAAIPSVDAANYAAEVLSYTAGTGAAAGFDNTSSVLGEPSRITDDPHPQFGGQYPVDPFSSPYLSSQLLSIGSGGSVTIRFFEPVANAADNPFGADFMIFGNSGFVITNDFDEDFNYIGEPATDGSLYGSNTGGETEVWVSADNLTYFQLDSSLAPAVDVLFPTDGAGDFTRPVDPSLAAQDFAGLTLEGIRSRYKGSGGGTPFDISWARDGDGAPVDLDSISYVRLDVLSGASEIDGFSAVPEPSTWALFAMGIAGLGFGLRRRMARV